MYASHSLLFNFTCFARWTLVMVINIMCWKYIIPTNMEGHHLIVQKFEVLIQPDVLDNITIARILHCLSV